MASGADATTRASHTARPAAGTAPRWIFICRLISLSPQVDDHPSAVDRNENPDGSRSCRASAGALVSRVEGPGPGGLGISSAGHVRRWRAQAAGGAAAGGAGASAGGGSAGGGGVVGDGVGGMPGAGAGGVTSAGAAGSPGPRVSRGTLRIGDVNIRPGGSEPGGRARARQHPADVTTVPGAATAPAVPVSGISRSIAPRRTTRRIVPRLSASRIGSTPGSRRVETSVSTPGDRQLLVLRIGQVDDLGDEIAAVDDLVEVLGRELDRDRVVRQVGVGGRGRGCDLDRRVELHALAARDVGQLETVDITLHEVIPGRHGQLRGQIDAFVAPRRWSASRSSCRRDRGNRSGSWCWQSGGRPGPPPGTTWTTAALVGRDRAAGRRGAAGHNVRAEQLLQADARTAVSESVPGGRRRQEQHTDCMHGKPPTPAAVVDLHRGKGKRRYQGRMPTALGGSLGDRCGWAGPDQGRAQAVPRRVTGRIGLALRTAPGHSSARFTLP